MKLVFISNYMTMHQLPFCLELYNELGDDFTFIEVDEIEAERVNMGWQSDFKKYSFIKKYEDASSPLLIENCDVLLCGSVHICYIKNRLKGDKITFRYFERLYKKGRIHALSPRGYIRKLMEHTWTRNKNVYLLCAGAYVPADFDMFFSYPGRKLKWGYFPKGEDLSFEELMAIKKKNDKANILWTGRFLKWKQPVMVVLMAQLLRLKAFDFHITMIGDGEEKAEVEKYIEYYELSDYITLLGFMDASRVREYMRQADVYICTSNFAEGWGAVINEAMSSACEVVASAGAGASGYLITHEFNGLIYDTFDPEDLCHEVMKVLWDKKFAHDIALNGYETMRDEWSPKEAATRFLEMSNSLMAGEGLLPYEHGPLSMAYKLAPANGYYCFTADCGESIWRE